MAKQMTPEQMARYAYDYCQIQNVMSRHMYYHAAGKHHEELDDIWVKQTPEPTWSNNTGTWVGMESIRKFYGDMHDQENQKNLEKVVKKHPEIENKRENWGIGTMVIHPQTTPVIEIAEDGKTAKGVWYSPGSVTEINEEGEPFTQYMWEKYGVDFAKEDSEWKIWHIHMYYDISVPPTQSWNVYPEPTAQAAPHGMKPDRPPKVIYRHHTPTTVPQIMPELPRPYKTFADVAPY